MEEDAAAAASDLRLRRRHQPGRGPASHRESRARGARLPAARRHGAARARGTGGAPQAARGQLAWQRAHGEIQRAHGASSWQITARLPVGTRAPPQPKPHKSSPSPHPDADPTPPAPHLLTYLLTTGGHQAAVTLQAAWASAARGRQPLPASLLDLEQLDALVRHLAAHADPRRRAQLLPHVASRGEELETPAVLPHAQR